MFFAGFGALDAAVEAFLVQLAPHRVAPGGHFAADLAGQRPHRARKMHGFAMGLLHGDAARDVFDQNIVGLVENGLGKAGEGVQGFGECQVVIFFAVVLAVGADVVKALAVEAGNDHGIHGVVQVGGAFFLLRNFLNAPSLARPGNRRAVDGVGLRIYRTQQSNGMAGDDAGIHELAVHEFVVQMVGFEGEGLEFFAPVSPFHLCDQSFLAVFRFEFRIIRRCVAGGSHLLEVGVFELFHFFPPRGQAHMDFVVVVAFRGEAASFALAVIDVVAKGQVGPAVVAGAAARDGVFNVKSGRQQFVLANGLPGIEALHILFFPEDVAQDVGIAGVGVFQVGYQALTGFVAGGLAGLLPSGIGHAGVAVIDAAGQFHMNAGIGIYATGAAQEVDLLAQDGEGALDQRIAQHAHVHRREHVAAGFGGGIGIVLTGNTEIEALEIFGRDFPHGLHVIPQAFLQGNLAVFQIVGGSLGDIGNDLFLIGFKRIRAQDGRHIRQKDGLGKFNAAFDERGDFAQGTEAVLGIAVAADDFAECFCFGFRQPQLLSREDLQTVGVFEKHQGVKGGLVGIGHVAAVGCFYGSLPGEAIAAQQFIELVGDGAGGHGFLVGVIVPGAFRLFEGLGNIGKADIAGGLEERPGGSLALLIAQGYFVAIFINRPNSVDERPHAIHFENGVGHQAARVTLFERALAYQMGLRAQAALEKQDIADFLGQGRIHFLDAGNLVKFLLVVFHAAGVATAHLFAALVQVVEMLAEGPVLFLQNGRELGDGVFDLAAFIHLLF